MRVFSISGLLVLTLIVSTAAGCGRLNFGEPRNDASVSENILRQRQGTPAAPEPRDTIWDLFANVDDPNTTVEVNKYIWFAAQDILNFMPIEAADPFAGIIVYGYGRPPGGGSPYRATVYVQDPALDARSLRVALASRSGPVSADTARAIEDAILTRARQLRLQASRL
ncbi:DUF3576 domain-containing protein [Rhodobacteraceae bacterium CCMM004]|nr:DUF3576 domain-containing protein [Rhodobacteraceae bacterium CCMM004]